MPSFLSVSGSPITTSGTFAITLATETANTVFAGPTSGGAATPTFRALVSADIPSLGYVTSVGFSVPATSIFAVTGTNPITSSGTFGFSVTGNSGGIPYFNSGSSLSTSAVLTANAIMLGGGASIAPSSLGSLGTTTTVLHGNAAGAPTFGAVSLTADVSGTLPLGNGGTGQTSFSSGIIHSNGSALSSSAVSLTADVSGILPIANGGSGSATTSQNFAFIGPTSGSGAPSFRALVAGDVPSLSYVTSVALSVPAASIFGVSGSPVTSSGTLALSTTGTSGGVAYFSSTSAVSSSALLTANALVLGGGAGSAPVVLGSLGTTSTVLHGNAAGAPTFGAIVNADITNATIDLTTKVTGVLPIANGGASDESFQLQNLTLTATVGSSALTISVKDKGGSNASATSPIYVGFRNATIATGTYSQVAITGALSLVVSSGSTLGWTSAFAENAFIYLINNAGTAELAISTALYVDEGTVITTTAEGGAGAADSRTAIYSTTARTGVAIRLIGRITATEATAGTWATAPSQISLVPFSYNVPATASTQAERVERANIANNGTATITSQSGSWITSVNRSAAGIVDITIPTGYFSAVPTAVVVLTNNSGRTTCINSITATAIQVITTNVGVANVDANFSIIVMGPR